METNQHISSNQERLKLLLDQKKCFKLICGAGNKNLYGIEKLVALYAKAGCYFFDFAADENVLIAAQKGLDFAIPKREQKNYHFCISIGTSGDQHVQKAIINQEECIKCRKCIEICPQSAIDEKFKILKDKCIGCLKCKPVCKRNAIKSCSENTKFNLEDFKNFNISCIELHASGINETEVDEIWSNLQKFDGMLSLCLGRAKLNDEQILNRVEKLVKIRNSYSTIIQADGVSMSGGNNDFETTLPAVEMGALIQSLNLPFYLLLSGGTNSKTAELARKYKVNINGIAVGSYARKIVREYIEKDNFLTDKTLFNQALNIAEKLISSTY